MTQPPDKIKGPTVVVATDDTDKPMVEKAAAPNLNKTTGAAAGTVGGGTVGVIVLFIMHSVYHVDFGPEASGAISAAAAAIFGTLATFFVPLITAAQQRALRKLEQ